MHYTQKQKRALYHALCMVMAAWGMRFTASCSDHDTLPDSDPYNFRPSKQVVFEASPLPLVFIQVNGQVIEKDSKTLATMTVIDNDEGPNFTDLAQHPDQHAAWEGPVSVRYRGNSSFYNSRKKPLSIRPLTAPDLNAKKEKVAMMGMAKDNDWVLLAPWEDKSYMRDILTMELARGGHCFAPHMRYCEVFVDGYYHGLFLMAERPTKGKHRLCLDDPDSNDLTGDYHVEVDRNDEPYYHTSRYCPVTSSGRALTHRRIVYQYKEPDYAEMANLPAGVRAAIDHEIDTMEDAFAAADYTHPDKGYRRYIDVDSFIDFQIAQEFANNVDAYRLSTPLYKYSDTHAAKLGTDSKWKMALWDFNLAYGNAGYYGANTNGWRYQANDLMAICDRQLVPFYWYRLMQDPTYTTQLKARWNALRTNRYSDKTIAEKIDSLSDVLLRSGALARDNEAWNHHFGDHARQVETLRQCIANRLRFLDNGWKEDVKTGN